MNINEYLNTVIETEPEHWIYGEQPPYFLHHSHVESNSAGEISNATTYAPHGHAVLKENLDISFYWGRDWINNFEENWASEKFAAKNPSGSCLDFCYRGAQILTQRYVNVDGARYFMPLPEQDFTEDKIDFEDDAIKRLWLPEQKVNFYRLFNGMFGVTDFDNALSRTGIEIQPGEWEI